jgi:hypothetical protein
LTKSKKNYTINRRVYDGFKLISTRREKDNENYLTKSTDSDDDSIEEEKKDHLSKSKKKNINIKLIEKGGRNEHLSTKKNRGVVNNKQGEKKKDSEYLTKNKENTETSRRVKTPSQKEKEENDECVKVFLAALKSSGINFLA